MGHKRKHTPVLENEDEARAKDKRKSSGIKAKCKKIKVDENGTRPEIEKSPKKMTGKARQHEAVGQSKDDVASAKGQTVTVPDKSAEKAPEEKAIKGQRTKPKKPKKAKDGQVQETKTNKCEKKSSGRKASKLKDLEEEEKATEGQKDGDGGLKDPKAEKRRLMRLERKKKKKEKIRNLLHESKGHSKALRYLEDWHRHQKNQQDHKARSAPPAPQGAGSPPLPSSGWKFEKCRQIWLLANAYDDKKVPDQKFDILLKYIFSVKGKARESILDEARKKVEKENVEGDEAEVPEKRLQRAKDIVEMLS